MPHLSIRLLGPVQVSLDGQPITRYETKKGRALLAFLAVESDQPFRRAKLAEMLWPGRPEGAARANLRHALAELRTAIGDREAIPPFLLTTRDTIQFNPASDAWVDVSAFSVLLQGCQEPEQTRGRQTSQQLEEAVKLFRGPFLEDVSVADSAVFEEWLLLKRERLGRQASDALRWLAKRHEQMGQHELALEHTWHQIRLEPWQEAAHRRVMRLLVVTGRRDTALAQFDACRRILAQDLDIEPEEETIALAERIREGPELLRSQPAPLHNLPLALSPFVGRQDELAGIQDRLLDPACRLLTLVGPGGIGKTRLALAAGAVVAENQALGDLQPSAPSFPQGIVFVPLAPLSSADGIVPAMAEACRLQLERGQEQLLDYLRQKQMLLIVDNLEHLADGFGLLAEILQAAPGVKLLATSRERLRLYGEQVFPVQGLAFPEVDPTPSTLASVGIDSYVEAYPAIKLLVGRARGVEPSFAPGPDDLIAMAGICRLVDGMPLALELAASWVDTLALDGILVEIRQSLDFLQTQWRDIPQRQRSVRAVFDASWGQLGQAEQALFPQLSVFRGGFTRAAAEQVATGDMATAVSPRLLSRLVNKSFIQYDQTHDRYRMHELLRQYGAEKLAHDPIHDAEVRDRHSSHFCRWLREQEANLKSVRQQETLLEIETEIENVRTACNWAASQGQAEQLSEILDALGLFYDWRRNYQAGETIFGKLAEILMAACEPPSPMTDITNRAMARTLIWQSKMNGFLANIERLERLAQEGLAHLDSLQQAGQDTRLERAHVGIPLAYAQFEANPEVAKRLFAGSRDLYQETGDSCGQADALVGLGRIARNLHALEEAKESFVKSLALRQAMGDQLGSAESMALLSDIALRQGLFAKAERLIRESLAIIPDPSSMVTWSYTLICTGRFVEAKTPAQECAALYTKLGMQAMAFWSFMDLSHVHLHLGEYHRARVHAEKVLSLARQVDSGRKTGLALGQLAAVALTERAYALARERCEESLTIYQQVLEHPSPRDTLGLAARGLGQRAQARRCLLAQLQWSVEHQSYFPLVFTLPGIALLLADEGQAERAVEVYALAARYPLVANSRWFEEIAGREIAAVADQLPPQTATEARARGQAADLWPAMAEWLEILTTEFGQTEEVVINEVTCVNRPEDSSWGQGRGE